MTLKELQNKIEKTMGKDLPTAAYLRAGNSPIVASRELDGGTKLSVYQNGFALYQTEGGSTVFRVDYCGGYTYFGRNEQTELSEDFFADTDWWVRLLMEGEDRLTHNRNIKAERHESLFEGDSEAFYNICGTEQPMHEEIMERDRIDAMLSILTVRQRELVTLYYIDGLGIKEIAKVCGISFQAVSIALSESRKKFEKNREKIKKIFETT